MKAAKGAFVYLLTNDRGNVLYTGCTEDLKERVYFHRKGMIPGFTKKYIEDVHKSSRKYYGYPTRNWSALSAGRLVTLMRNQPYHSR